MDIIFYIVSFFLVPTLFYGALVAKFREDGRRGAPVLGAVLIVLVVLLLLKLGANGGIW